MEFFGAFGSSEDKRKEDDFLSSRDRWFSTVLKDVLCIIGRLA